MDHLLALHVRDPHVEGSQAATLEAPQIIELLDVEDLLVERVEDLVLVGDLLFDEKLVQHGKALEAGSSHLTSQAEGLLRYRRTVYSRS